uniref:Uncharacterized protein n=1 Tax=Rangifer tarandus platyrhynchus TaxID=3082113 RepID=A0ACB0E8M7_RANTA|nr:unnamed protein product [Rangifer tarandus platyrhynchus]
MPGHSCHNLIFSPLAHSELPSRRKPPGTEVGESTRVDFRVAPWLRSRPADGAVPHGMDPACRPALERAGCSKFLVPFLDRNKCLWN